MGPCYDSYAVWFRSFWPQFFFLVPSFFQLFCSDCLGNSHFYNAPFVILHCSVDFFWPLIKGPICFHCFAPIFLATVIFKRRIFQSYTVLLRFFRRRHFYKAHFFQLLCSNFLATNIFLRRFFKILITLFGSDVFRHSHFSKVSLFIFNCLVPIFLATVIFIRRIFFYLCCLVQIFLGTVIFISCHFLQLICSGFFLATVIFIRIFVFIVHCLVQIFLAPVIFIRCNFCSTVLLRFFWQQSFL